MPEIATLSSTGELKIPLRTRTRLGLSPGQKFDVRIDGGNVVLVALGPPPELAVKEFLAWKETHQEPTVIRLKPRSTGRSKRALRRNTAPAGCKKQKR